MEASTSQIHCKVCCENISDSCNVTRAVDLEEILKALVNTNFECLQDVQICESCVTKIQSAYKFKLLYSEGCLNTVENVKVKEKINSEDFVCQMCNKNLSPQDSIPFLDSVPNVLIVTKHFSTEFGSNVPENIRTCEECHKSLLNFCTITNSISIFEKDDMININSSNDNFKFNIKQENMDWCFEDVKEKDIDYTLEDLKDEVGDDEAYQDSLMKNEEVNVKSDKEEEEDEERKSKTRRKPPFVIKRTTKNSTHEEKIGNVFQCQNCEYQTHNKRNITRHVLIHKSIDEVEIFQCDVCSYNSKRKDVLKHHMLIHKNVEEIEMFPCEFCDYQSKRRNGLIQHMLIHKSVDEIRIFKCEICEFQTKRKSDLTHHILTHKNFDETEMYQCQTCKYQTKRNSDIHRHMMIHKNADEVESFKCPKCDHKTKHKRSLKRHMLIHEDANEIEMFQCEICDYRTRRKSDLKRHKIRKHTNSN